jgi:hypothetical protein
MIAAALVAAAGSPAQAGSPRTADQAQGIRFLATDSVTGEPVVRVTKPTVVRSGPVGAGAAARADVWVYHGRFEIRNRQHTGMCLDAHNNGQGLNHNRIGLWQCNGGITEKWHLYENLSRPDWEFELVNARTPEDGKANRCLDYPADSGGRNGFQYLLWDCVESSGQKFRLALNTNLNAYIFAVQLGGANNHMDAFANDPAGGGNLNKVGNWAWTGHPLQHWQFREA